YGLRGAHVPSIPRVPAWTCGGVRPTASSNANVLTRPAEPGDENGDMTGFARIACPPAWWLCASCLLRGIHARIPSVIAPRAGGRPRAGESPLALERARRDVQRLGDLGDRQSPEHAKLDHLRPAYVELLELLERIDQLGQPCRHWSRITVVQV